jgi:hypothetical protein
MHIDNYHHLFTCWSSFVTNFSANSGQILDRQIPDIFRTFSGQIPDKFQIPDKISMSRKSNVFGTFSGCLCPEFVHYLTRQFSGHFLDIFRTVFFYRARFTPVFSCIFLITFFTQTSIT